MRRIVVHLALMAGAARALAGCGIADGRSPVPEFMRARGGDPPPAEPPPDVEQLVGAGLDSVFVASSNPQKVRVSPPRHDLRGLGWTACVKAELTAAMGEPLGEETYRITISSGVIIDRRRAQVRGDLFARKTLPAQDFDLFDDRRRRWPVEAFRPRRAIHQTRSPLRLEAANPFAGRPRADACGMCGGLRRLPARHRPNQMLSTQRRHSGILMHVHPVPPWTLKLRNLSFLGPDRMDNLLRAHI